MVSENVLFAKGARHPLQVISSSLTMPGLAESVRYLQELTVDSFIPNDVAVGEPIDQVLESQV
jgi:hypothetical protein